MRNKKEYTGIDYFRIIAAFLVVANHTSPLAAYNETADFILTRIIARTAVPFFFMTSAFFLFANNNLRTDKIKSVIKKTIALYAFAILLYIPINLYNGYFKMNNLPIGLLRDLVFNGTLYHLWYLPALILGAVFAWILIKKTGYKSALLITSLLYVIGLFGDSYYGLVKHIPFINGFYTVLFQISDYTRNGIFFAPIFFVIGGIIANQKRQYTLIINLIGCLLSLISMVAEGLLLHNINIQRHDSMYIMLPICMFFLFNSLLCWRGQRKPALRTASVVIYLIHPMMIVAIRLAAKILHLQGILVENSIIHYLTVAIFSSILAIPVVIISNYKKHNKSKKHQSRRGTGTDRAWVEINLKNMGHNVSTLQNIMPETCEMMAVVKADAYGHGAVRVSKYLNKIGVKTFAVATLEEGIQLRESGVTGDILVLGYTNPLRAWVLEDYQLIQTIIDYDYAKMLNESANQLLVHIKVDTGMHRLGISSGEENQIEDLFRLEHLEVCGIFTHLSASSSQLVEDITYTKEQIMSFYTLIDDLQDQGIQIPKVHIQSSYGLLNYPELQCNYVRAGIALYGSLTELGDTTKADPDIWPVLSIKARIALIRELKLGQSVGYDNAFTAERNIRIAILPIGYADGLPRKLSCGNGMAIINGQKVPIIGRICMDQLMVDITDVIGVNVGDIATLLGKDGEEEITAVQVAHASESITNELLSRIGNRLPKRYLSS